MKIKTASLTDCGGRSVNDDTVRIHEDSNCVWAFVGDGLGGYAGGRQASQAAGQALHEASRRGSLMTPERMNEAARQADAAVHALQREKAAK